jgi:hypothetical protein
VGPHSLARDKSSISATFAFAPPAAERGVAGSKRRVGAGGSHNRTAHKFGYVTDGISTIGSGGHRGRYATCSIGWSKRERGADCSGGCYNGDRGGFHGEVFSYEVVCASFFVDMLVNNCNN